MNYENSINGLIKQLKGISNDLMEDEFPKCVNVVKKATTALFTLHAENKRLKSLLGESGQDLWSKENQRADRLKAENEKLRAELKTCKEKNAGLALALLTECAPNPDCLGDDEWRAIRVELERVKRERGAAIADWQGFCAKCVWNGKQYLSDGKMDDRCKTCRDNNKCNWEWRGIKED